MLIDTMPWSWEDESRLLSSSRSPTDTFRSRHTSGRQTLEHYARRALNLGPDCEVLHGDVATLLRTPGSLASLKRLFAADEGRQGPFVQGDLVWRPVDQQFWVLSEIVDPDPRVGRSIAQHVDLPLHREMLRHGAVLDLSLLDRVDA